MRGEATAASRSATPNTSRAPHIQAGQARGAPPQARQQRQRQPRLQAACVEGPRLPPPQGTPRRYPAHRLQRPAPLRRRHYRRPSGRPGRIVAAPLPAARTRAHGPAARARAHGRGSRAFVVVMVGTMKIKCATDDDDDSTHTRRTLSCYQICSMLSEPKRLSAYNYHHCFCLHHPCYLLLLLLLLLLIPPSPPPLYHYCYHYR